jgi:DNA modification methylase
MRAPYYDDGDVTLHHGHALDVARTLETGSVRTIVTSPPYFGLRDYGHDDQLGAEPTVDAYVQNLVTLFRELRRVLTDDGTLWLNLGDSYSGAGPSGASYDSPSTRARAEGNGMDGNFRVSKRLAERDLDYSRKKPTPTSGIPSKNLIGVPWRVAFALQTDGWILRSDIIWAKKNVMPESVTDRPTKAHEYLFLLAKGPRYYYDAEAIKEPATMKPQRRLTASPMARGGTGRNDAEEGRNLRSAPTADGDDRNKRDVWTVATQPFAGAHFAVYPPELIRPCILAGSAPGDTVLDPFSGSGTTGMVATFEGRKYVGIDINAEYLDLSIRTRFAQPTLGIEAV